MYYFFLFQMKTFYLLLIVLLSILLISVRGFNQHGVDTEDNDFAEFEDFDGKLFLSRNLDFNISCCSEVDDLEYYPFVIRV